MGGKVSSEYHRQWRAKNPDKVRAIWERYSKKNPHKLRDRMLKAKHKITSQQYDQLFRQQGGACAICSTPSRPGESLYVDHCHASNRIRGLLCFHCNVALGHFKDSPELLSDAIEYLNKAGAAISTRQ